MPHKRLKIHIELGKEISTKLVLFSFFVKTLKLLDTTP